MKLRVNLYIQALQPVQERISLKRVLLSMVGLGLVLSAAAWLLNSLVHSKQADLVVLQQQVKAQEQQLKQLQDKIAQHQPSALLVKQRTEFIQTIAQKQKLLQFVQGEQRKTSVKYSPVMRYLASIDPQGFWLTSFSLSANSSEFSGYLTAPEVLPQWLNQLGGTEFFKGHTFSQFEINQAQNSEALVFKVTSEAASKEASP